MFVFVDLRPWNSVLCGREIFFAVYEGYLGFNVLVLVLAASFGRFVEFSGSLLDSYISDDRFTNERSFFS